jgi:predicted amidohydrolase YtcJ
MDELTIPFLGERRSSWQYPFGSLLAAGAPLCAGSDWSVSSPDPIAGAHVAVNRSMPAESGAAAGDGTSSDPFLPDQVLSAEAIFAAYTSGSASVNGLEGVTGSIRPGLDADLAVVDADLSRLPAAEICRASVVQTWVRGEVAYQRT